MKQKNSSLGGPAEALVTGAPHKIIQHWQRVYGWLGLKPSWLGLRPGWLSLRPGWMAQSEDERMNGRKIFPLYRTSFPIEPLPKNCLHDGISYMLSAAPLAGLSDQLVGLSDTLAGLLALEPTS